MEAVHPKRNHVILHDNEIIHYDYLIIASGASPDWDKIKGLKGKSVSLYDIPSAFTTRKKLKKMEDGEPIVIGVSQQNPNPGIAYEFLFELDDYLNERGMNNPMTFFTSEKELFDGKGTEPTEKLEELMMKKQIPYYCDISIEKVDRGKVYLNNGEQLPYSHLLILPPYKGKEFIFSSKNLKHKNGILPVQENLQSIQWDNIYVVGDGNNLNGGKTGRVAELQGMLAAENIIKQMNHEPLHSFQHETLYVMEIGDEGGMFIMDKPLEQGTFQWTMSGMIPHMMKRAYEKYYLLKFR